MQRWAWILALMASLTTVSHAQLPRQFPAGAKLGEMVGQQQLFPLVEIDKKVMRLAPGGRVIDENNRIILHAYLPPLSYVLYVVDMNGDLSRVFILRPDELEVLKRTLAPAPAPAPAP
jgi:hypothetical protein